MESKFAFFSSTRFWALVIGATSLYLQAKGWIGDAEMTLVGTLVTGFIGIRTVDRIGDKRVEAAKIEGDAINESQS